MRAVIAFTMMIALLPTASAGADTLAEARTALARAVDDSDAAGMIAAAARFESLARSEPSSPLPPYWMAVAEWRLVPVLTQGPEAGKNHALAKKHCEAGLAAAERALKLDPNSAEALAIRVGLQGLSLRFASPMAMMSLGPRMEEDLARARAMAPESPRVHLIDGMNTLHKPAFVGGGAKPALPKFEKAIACFEKDTASVSHPHGWGRADAHLWAGRAAMKLEAYEAAQNHFTHALEAEPGRAWVREVLLPSAANAIQADANAKRR